MVLAFVGHYLTILDILGHNLTCVDFCGHSWTFFVDKIGHCPEMSKKSIVHFLTLLDIIGQNLTLLDILRKNDCFLEKEKGKNNFFLRKKPERKILSQRKNSGKKETILFPCTIGKLFWILRPATASKPVRDPMGLCPGFAEKVFRSF